MKAFRVLYVDDEPGLLEIGRIFLELGGQFTVDTIAEAPSALALLEKEKFDAVISDYQMPGMDGIEFLKRVRRSGNTIPFILFTGRGREEVVIQALNEGADFYLQKGGDPMPQFTELSHKVRQAIQRQQAEVLLSESQAQLHTVVNSIHAGILIIDAATHRILSANPRAVEMMERSPEEIVGSVCHGFICPSEAGRCPVTDLGKTVDLSERVLLRQDGRNTTILKSAVPAVIDGREVLIESFFDIADRKQTEQEIKERNAQLIAISDMEREFAGLSSGERVEERAAKKLLAISGAVVTTFNVYDRAQQLLRAAAIEIGPGVLRSLPDAWKKVAGLVGMDPLRITVPVTPAMYQDIHRSYITTKRSVSEMCNGEISPAISAAIQKLGGIDRFLLLTHVIDGELYGTSLLGLRTDQPDPPMEILDSFAHMVAVSLRRQQAEAALRESEERLRQITENINTVFYLFDRSSKRFSYVSPAYERIWMQSCQSLLDDPHSYLSAVHPDDLPRLQEAIRKDLEEDVFIDMEYRIFRPDGALRWIHSRNFPVTDRTGTVFRVAGFADDITDLKNSRQALQESEEKYRLIAENTADYIFIFDMDLRLRYVSPSVKRMRGFTPEEALALPLEQQMTPESVARVLALFEDEMKKEAGEAADPGRRVFFETEEYCRDGSTIQVENSVTLLRDGNGRTSGILGISRDITERKRAEQALRESEEKFRSLVEHSLESVSIIDFTGQGIFANRATARMLELDGDARLTGRNIMEFLAPESRGQAVEDMARVMGGRDVFLAWYTLITAKGNTRHIECIGKVISYEGKPAVLLSLHDITGLRNAEERLRLANRQLTLLTGITRHDILNKVSVIRGFLQLAKKKTSDPAMNSFLDRIDTETDAIRAQIEFTRVYQDLGTQEPQWLLLADVIPRTSVPLPIAFSMDSQGLRIFADPMLKTVFSNLLDNSIRHGGKVTAIRLSAIPAGKDLMVVWEDNGVGIPAEEKGQVFERGYGKNTGLGMFLAREILSLTGITIRENGEPGKGARFEITVPAGAYRLAGE